MESIVSSYRQSIVRMLASKDLAQLVEGYFDLSGPFAATSFDLVGANDYWRVTTDDALAVSFLDTPLRAASWRILERQSRDVSSLLLRIDPTLPLWKLEEEPGVYDAASSLWNLLLEIEGMGITRVSKLMARKRPHLFPILDSRVREFFGDVESFWLPLGRVLQDEKFRMQIRSLAPAFAETDISTLRILDVAIWRHQRGLPPGTVDAADD